MIPHPDCTIDLAGERLTLMPERAAYWARESLLLVADAHFGKAASFRAQGVPVPSGTTTETLDRLTSAVSRSGARRVVFLGDFLHSRQARAPETLGALGRWRERHPTLELLLVRGNHDAHAGDPPALLDIAPVDEPFAAGAFALCHAPLPHPERYVLAGHLHPAVVLRGRAHERLRLPCFVFGSTVGVLPAFGSFTGTATWAPGPDDRICVIAGDRVVRLPEATGERRSMERLR